VNYCQSCRRHLNGAVSCPGCGAAGVVASGTQDSRSTDWKTEAAWPERDLPPTVESHASTGARESADRDVARTGSYSAARAEGLAGAGTGGATYTGARAGEGAHAALRAPLRGGDGKSDEREPGRTDVPAVEAPNGRRGRGSRKRRGLGLKVTVTGGFAGIAVVGLLVLGNIPPTGGGAPFGAVAAVTASTSQNPGSVSSPGVSTPTPTGSGSRATAISNTATTSPSPSPSTTSLPPSSSATPDHSATSAQAAQPTRPTTVSSGEQSAQPTTTPPAPSPSPSSSKTQVNCFLVICW
jgi:hypothetical protein